MHFLKNCSDFKHEKFQTEYILEEQLGAVLRMAPKYHPKIAGQGIEYTWEYSKLKFRQEFNNTQAYNLEQKVRNILS